MARKPLEPNLWSVNDVFKHMYSVPVYQRPYSWGSGQIDVFLDDRDSKDAITMFSTIMNDVYVRSTINKNVIVNVIAIYSSST